jgi:predicted permease
MVFIIACSNVANLILARSIRRESELAVRAALGASRGALRRALLGESLVLCGAGAVLGVLLARPLVSVVRAYAARFSVRALEVGVDGTVLWVGAGLAMAAAFLLAYVPRLPSAFAAPRVTRIESGPGLAASGVRLTQGTRRRLRAFATTQIAFSFVLLAAAAVLVATLIALQTANTGVLTRQVLAFDIPWFSLGDVQQGGPDLYRDLTERVARLPGVDGVSGGLYVPWRDSGRWPHAQVAVEGYTPADGEEHPYARQRSVGPGYFATLGIPVVAGREFTEADRIGPERVAIVNQSMAQRLFPGGDALNRRLWRTSSLSASGAANPVPSRIIGVVADVDDESGGRAPALAVYAPYRLPGFPMRLFVRTSGDPYALVEPVRKIIRDLSPNQAVERAATLEDVRVDALTPERLNAFVVSGFAGIALLIAVVGVSGVLAFSVSARTREFGVRLAVGSAPRHLLVGVLAEGASIVAIGIAAGAAGAYALAGAAQAYVSDVRPPGMLPLAAAAVVLAAAALAASLLPAARASRVDVLQALRSE